MTSPIRYYKFTPPEKFTIKTRWSYIHVDTVNEAEQMFSAPLELWTSTTDDRYEQERKTNLQNFPSS